MPKKIILVLALTTCLGACGFQRLFEQIIPMPGPTENYRDSSGVVDENRTPD